MFVIRYVLTFIAEAIYTFSTRSSIQCVGCENGSLKAWMMWCLSNARWSSTYRTPIKYCLNRKAYYAWMMELYDVPAVNPDDYEVVYQIFGSALPPTLEEIEQELAEAGINCRVDGMGYVTAACDGYSPEMLTAAGCRPVTTMDRVW